MTTSALPDLCPKLGVDKRIQNIFVTQPEDTRQRKEEAVNHGPALGASSSVLKAGLVALKKDLVLKKQAELDEVDIQLLLKQQEFTRCMETLAMRRSELEIKQQQTKEKVMKFEKFVGENVVKRSKALKKCEATRVENILKQSLIEDRAEQLKQLRARKQELKERMEKYKIYENFLMETLDCLPSIYRDSGSESLVMPIIQRHKTLFITHQKLLQRFGDMEAKVEQGQRQLRSMKQECGIKKLTASKELLELQSELEILNEQNKKAEVVLLMQQGISREKAEEVGKLLMAINNLAEQCYLPEYGNLQSMSKVMMMDMVKEYILDKMDTEKRARVLMESISAGGSRDAVTDKRWRGSIKSIKSKRKIQNSKPVKKK
ncbi:coiled-coil domain-containing protein 42 homolog [Cololabis saira]|uniref:coiled-coil domain-containing protein 42 homolog n=1 Tax=Cololabis saira TaxID=129043 RepID=UPI002AD370DD|nr:coiled-coil domain-containing protein 42 homolog [Cololabis saira]